LQNLWSESSSASTVNLAKKLLQFQRYQIFHRVTFLASTVQYMLSTLSYVLSSVRLSVTQLDQSNTVEVRIVQFSPYSRPLPQFFLDKFHPEIRMGSPQAGTSYQTSMEWVKQFSSSMRQYLDIRSKTLLMISA